MTAIGQDDEMVELVNANKSIDQNNTKTQRPTAQGWDYRRADLADIKDLLMVIAKVSAHSEEPIKFVPRPETAQERWEKDQRKQNTSWLMDQIGLDHD